MEQAGGYRRELRVAALRQESVAPRAAGVLRNVDPVGSGVDHGRAAAIGKAQRCIGEGRDAVGRGTGAPLPALAHGDGVAAHDVEGAVVRRRVGIDVDFRAAVGKTRRSGPGRAPIGGNVQGVIDDRVKQGGVCGVTASAVMVPSEGELVTMLSSPWSPAILMPVTVVGLG